MSVEQRLEEQRYSGASIIQGSLMFMSIVPMNLRNLSITAENSNKKFVKRKMKLYLKERRKKQLNLMQ